MFTEEDVQDAKELGQEVDVAEVYVEDVQRWAFLVREG